MPEHPWRRDRGPMGLAVGPHPAVPLADRRRMQQMREDGYSVNAIAKTLGYAWTTVRKYVED